MLLDLDLEDVAWVLDYVAESSETDSDDCVVRAAKRLIDQLGEQLPPIVMEAVNADLDHTRGDRFPNLRGLWVPAYADT